MEAPPAAANDRAPAIAEPGEEAAPSAARNRVLLRLEQLAVEELGAARPLADAGPRADVLDACIQWDLDSSTG